MYAFSSSRRLIRRVLSRRRRGSNEPRLRLSADFRRFIPPIAHTLVHHHHYTNAPRNYSFRRPKQTNDPPAMIFDPRRRTWRWSRTCAERSLFFSLFFLSFRPKKTDVAFRCRKTCTRFFLIKVNRIVEPRRWSRTKEENRFFYMKYKYERNTQILMRVYFSIEQINDSRRGGRVQRDRSFSPFSFFLFARETKNRGLFRCCKILTRVHISSIEVKKDGRQPNRRCRRWSQTKEENLFPPPPFSFYTKYKNETNRDVFLYIFFYRAN